jgi:hypothetical protein
MATRPWITPQDVKDYTEYPSVASRADAKIAVDISRAESYIIDYTNNDFGNAEHVPGEVKTAAVLLTEAYAYNAANAPKDGYKSETFDEYSYTAFDNPNIDPGTLAIAPLLDGYIIVKPRDGVTMRLRKL